MPPATIERWPWRTRARSSTTAKPTTKAPMPSHRAASGVRLGGADQPGVEGGTSAMSDSSRALSDAGRRPVARGLPSARSDWVMVPPSMARACR